ncbi:MAG: UDP-N-acetylmuramoyl-L-alanine--D-glutamate ligase [Clostridia bacterium]|nr:UDP-N-acetylmuramoyl-L-alanine--D-glutamate ligase [Clostridia bacterium]
MNVYDKIRDAHCVILGYGVSGKPLLPYLLDHGAGKITVRDKRSLENMQASGEAQAILTAGAELICGEAYLEDLSGDVIFRSPGFRPDLPEIKAAVEKGAVLSSEMELFLERTPATVIGVTGSDGKTTTTTLISKFLGAETELTGKGRVYLGGNIGTPLLPMVENMTAEDFAVVELSSFQLMTAKNTVHRAMITNITPNHLNWHVDMEEYVAAKARITEGDRIRRAVLNARDERTRGIGEKLSCPVSWFSAYDCTYPPLREGDRHLYIKNGAICCFDGREETPLLATQKLRLPGKHNVENYMTALGAVCDLVSTKAIEKVASEFTGVSHRLELIRLLDGVSYYNSSIDSSPTRTLAALSAIREMRELQGRDERGNLKGRDPVVICGGQDKHVPFDPLAEGLCRMASRVILTGEARGQIMDALMRCPSYDPEKLPVTVIPDYREAMETACRTAEAGDIVLLSPACTSFDAFKNFEERGEVFRNIVRSL